ncbi:MAG: heme-binding protein, partial [Sphingomonadales bacterium]|nr:heme-binding protein [Sphingomonadales bacterium]
VHGLSHATGFTLLGGGMPVVLDGQVIGGIGVSGGSAEEDLAIAEAALAALTAATTSPA